MPQVIFNAEWMLAAELTNRTGLTERQMKEYRALLWIEGIHYKRVPLTTTEVPKSIVRNRGLIWYNLPRINQLIQES